jgi:hypothetical protein
LTYFEGLLALLASSINLSRSMMSAASTGWFVGFSVGAADPNVVIKVCSLRICNFLTSLFGQFWHGSLSVFWVVWVE